MLALKLEDLNVEKYPEDGIFGLNFTQNGFHNKVELIG
jgi:hypothetical protein